MRLAVSNIAWGTGDLRELAVLLGRLGCDGVELAPSLLWQDPVAAPLAARRETAAVIADAGLHVAGLHSLLYSRPDLVLFADQPTRERAIAFLAGVIELCRDLRGSVLVFGSPQSRRRGPLSTAEAHAIAVRFFRRLATIAYDCGVVLLIEPLSPRDTDFVSSTAEAFDLVSAVDHPGFALHLDIGTLVTTGENIGEVFARFGNPVRHLHVADPGLLPPGSSGLDHAPIGRALRAAGYRGFISIEMRRTAAPPAEVIARSVRYVQDTYLAHDARSNQGETRS